MDTKQQGWAGRGILLGTTLALIAALMIFAGACGGDDDGDGNAAAAEAAARAAIDAWNGGDLDGFLGAFTDEGVIALFGGFSREEILESGDEIGAGDPQIEIQELSIDANEEEATAELTTIEGAFQYRQRVTLIPQGGTWLVNDFEHLTQDVPDDKTVVGVGLLEFEFAFDENANHGRQPSAQPDERRRGAPRDGPRPGAGGLRRGGSAAVGGGPG